MRISLIIVLILTIQVGGIAQAIYEDERSVPETDPLVIEKLDQWQDLKFGLLMHWGPYSQWGVVESWSLNPEDYSWCVRTQGASPQNYMQYKKEYEALKNTFNPVRFSPDKWAKAAREAGMKYMVFTTKHHDGFSMFDTKYTDYKVTDEGCKFSAHPKANITKEIFDAFRKEDMWVGAYFSKPDWHHENFWDPYFPPFDRNVNYDPLMYPEKWETFVEFTHNQLLELLTDYGKVDIIWLDGSWVKKATPEEIRKYYEDKFDENKSGNGFIKHRVVSQDLRMDELVEKARKKQPGLIVVDRAVHGKNQNYLTPENRVPEKALPYPWESCIISGGGWSYSPDAKYISGHQGIQMLVDIVAKGGNLLLNIAPSPEGEWQQGAYDLLVEFGGWMDVNGEGIYKTTPIAPYREKNICMTQKKNEDALYFFYLAEEGEKHVPERIYISAYQPKEGAVVHMLGSKRALSWEKRDEGFEIRIPKRLQNNPPCKYVWTFKVSETP